MITLTILAVLFCLFSYYRTYQVLVGNDNDNDSILNVFCCLISIISAVLLSIIALCVAIELIIKYLP